MVGEGDVESTQEHFEQFCCDTYITQKKNSTTMTQKRINAIHSLTAVICRTLGRGGSDLNFYTTLHARLTCLGLGAQTVI